jgi:hypothetical protein
MYFGVLTINFSLNKPEYDLALYKERTYSDLSHNDIREDYNSISYNTRHKEDQVGSSCFISKTKRGNSVSNIPGPGSYNVNYNNEVVYKVGK